MQEEIKACQEKKKNAACKATRVYWVLHRRFIWVWFMFLMVVSVLFCLKPFLKFCLSDKGKESLPENKQHRFCPAWHALGTVLFSYCSLISGVDLPSITLLLYYTDMARPNCLSVLRKLLGSPQREQLFKFNNEACIRWMAGKTMIYHSFPIKIRDKSGSFLGLFALLLNMDGYNEIFPCNVVGRNDYPV